MMSMLICRLYFKNIDYNSIVSRLMPIITRELSEKDNIFFTLLKKILCKNNKPSGFTKLLVSIAPNKDELAATLICQNADEIQKYANEALIRFKIAASIKAIRAKTVDKGCDKMIKLEVEIDNIDYEQNITNLMPLLMDILDKNKITNKAIAILTENSELAEKMVKAAIREIPEDKRDELLADILTEYKQEIINTANRAILKYYIKAELKEIEIHGKAQL